MRSAARPFIAIALAALAPILGSCASGAGRAAAPLLPAPGTEKSVKGDAAAIFDPTVLHRVDIDMDQAAYSRVIAEHVAYSAEAADYRLAARLSIDGNAIENVGIRGRGNSFNEVNKQSFKLKFNSRSLLSGSAPAALAPRMDLSSYRGRRFLGLEALNLRASNNDPTQVREVMSLRLFRDSGVPAPRASLAMLYVNGRPLGVYTICEEDDKRLLKGWFDDAGGSLYKCAWDSSGGASFKEGSYNPVRYSKREGADPSDASDIQAFMGALARVKSGADLEALVDKRNLIAYNAVCALVGHWDSLNGNINNDYVYRNPADGKWSVVVWDTDNSFGSDWIPTVDCRWSPLDTVARDPSSEALICSLASRYWAAETASFVKELLAKEGGGDSFAVEAYRLRDLIKDRVKAEDPYLRDYGAFLQSFDSKPAEAPFLGANIQQFRDGVGLISYYRQRLSHLSGLIR